MKFKAYYLLAAIPLMIGASLPMAIKASNANNFNKSGWESMIAQKMWKGHSSKLMESLNLTETQKEQVKEIQENKPEALEEGWTQLKAEMETMRSLAENNASTDELRQQHNKIQSLRTEMGSQRFEQMLKVYEILTPEQRKTFAQKLGKHRMWKRGRHHHRHNESETQKQSMLLTF